MKTYNRPNLDEIMRNIKLGTILIFYRKNEYFPSLPGTEIDFVKAIVSANDLLKHNYKKIIHCNRFKLVQNADTNEWTIYNGENTDYEFLYAYEPIDKETYKLIGNFEEK